ncbi:hypothetical protein ACE1MS_10835 [Lysinibacillus sp. fkY74-1]|uniref:Lipoprotein n=1 Tax=Lysinibacillus pinottii TaxID=2973932 RepID=A0ABT2DMZ7_9BACI|nr:MULTISPECIES: hypothetical protein [Lysinibacillus]MBE5083331.1 hypothetical protein [Bacillus thuringiensis]AMO33627.1 hypothetical protein AR327_14890 [Lysinibacillus sphaericus]AMR91266.1 hypothetical protein A1T07_14325 [Lysinibacillus sphaericus]ANA45314.1 hypothetical protein A2J09_06985 [Lysinibacillus sphaericus]KZL44777.1 hypothetical protein A2J08_07615 [Lysinibacillus sphaericus]
MKHPILILTVALLLTGCNEEIKNEPVHPIVQDQMSLLTFFPPDGSIAYFQGEGNEFASFTLQTTYLDPQHIAQVEDNGGVTLLKIYRITDSKIELIYREPVDSNPRLPSSTEVAAYPVLETVLQQPIQVGTSFQGWTIQSITAKVDTGTKVYSNVIQVTRTEDQFTTTNYFAQGVGLIKKEDRMESDQEQPFVVTSTLQKIE